MENDPFQALAAFLEEERKRVVRLWSKRLRVELQELEIAGKDLRAPLDTQISELIRLLKSRGEESLRLWPESVRSHGAVRYNQRFDSDDLAREYRILHVLLLRLYARRHEGAVPIEICEVLAELIGEAIAAVEASYARAVRTEEVRFREAGVMESILHNVEVGIILGELDGSISYATPAVARLLGVPVRALIGGRSTHALAMVLAQVNARHQDGAPFRAADLPFMRALKDAKPVRGVTAVVTKSNGETAIVEMSALPILEEGEMVGVLQTITDRTESKLRTHELSRAYDELRRLQARLLQRTRTQALGQLASGAAHALNNFLNVIRLRVTLLRKEFRPEHLDALDRTVKSIGELVTRLQEFSLVRTEEQLAEVRFDVVVQEAVDLARPELGQNDPPIVLEVDLHAGSPVKVDAILLREMVTNLLLAVRDRLSGGGHAKLSTQVVEGNIELRLTDDGPAYSDEELAKLFDPLKGASRTPQLSLLLAVARSQIQHWSGVLSCERSSEAGVVFTLKLPVAVPETTIAPHKAVRPARPVRAHQARVVLVVDDDLDNARMMAEVLTEEGYEVKVANAGDVALALWEQNTFDAALLDALMPDISGWDLAREIRKRTPTARVAMVTGADVRGQNRNNLALVDAVFRKPIDVEALDEFLSQSGPMSETEESPRLHS